MMIFNVPDMTCGHCAKAVTAAVHAVDPAASVDVDLRTKLVTVDSGAEADALSDAIRQAGYDKVAVVR
jgi:copper chaperone